MSALRRTATATALCAGLALTAGCQSNGNGKAQPLPPAESSTTTPTETRSASPTKTTQPAWQDKYSEKEIAAYETALDRFETYEQRSEPIWRRGKATPAAEELFKEYFQEGVWQPQLSRLRLYESSNVEVHGTPTVLRSQPTRITLSKQNESVTIRQCVDYSTVTGFQNGEETTKVTHKPQLRIVVSIRSVGKQESPWLISRIREFKGDRPCKS
jgi:hypothetical protein